MQVRYLPYRGSMGFGRGVNTLTGAPVGLALEPGAPEVTTGVTGQEAVTHVRIVRSHSELLENVGLSVEASGRYGLFSAEGKFSLAEKSKFNSQSTFITASCVVNNAFKMINRPKLLPEAEQMLINNKLDLFKTTYGDSFVRGIVTGGEFYAVIQITSVDQSQQNELAASLQAEYQGLVASGSFKASFDKSKSRSDSRTEIEIWIYQRAGQNEELSVTQDAGEVLARLRAFPRIANTNPVGYLAEVANYNTLALPAPNLVEVENREFALQDCARLQLRYQTMRNDLEFARINPIYFEDLPSASELSEKQEKYERAINLLMRHARNIASGSLPPEIFIPSKYDPSLVDLPTVILKRKNLPAQIPVPNLRTLTVEQAKAKLSQLELTVDENRVPVDQNSTAPLNTVISQEPQPDVTLPKGSRVRISYNYKPSNQFRWAIDPKIHKDYSHLFVQPQKPK